MKKFFKIFISIIIIVIIALIIFYIARKPIITSYLSHRLKINISFHKVKLRPSYIRITKLKIFNPSNKKIKDAFYSETIEVDFSKDKLKQNPAVLNKILIEDATLNVLCKNPLCTENNWTEIIRKINQNEDATKDKKEYNIEKISLKNIKINVHGLGVLNDTKKSFVIDNLELRNINSKRGFPTQQLIVSLFRSADMQDYLKGIFKDQNSLNKFMDYFN